jgi:hypothetical protein
LILRFDGKRIEISNTTIDSPVFSENGEITDFTPVPALFENGYCENYKLNNSILYTWDECFCDEFQQTEFPTCTKPKFDLSYNGMTLTFVLKNEWATSGNVPRYYNFIKY